MLIIVAHACNTNHGHQIMHRKYFIYTHTHCTLYDFLFCIHYKPYTYIMYHILCWQYIIAENSTQSLSRLNDDGVT